MVFNREFLCNPTPAYSTLGIRCCCPSDLSYCTLVTINNRWEVFLFGRYTSKTCFKP